MTDSEKRDQINAKVTQYYPKMYRDSMQIAGANFEKYGSDLLAYCLEDFLCNWLTSNWLFTQRRDSQDKRFAIEEIARSRVQKIHAVLK